MPIYFVVQRHSFFFINTYQTIQYRSSWKYSYLFCRFSTNKHLKNEDLWQIVEAYDTFIQCIFLIRRKQMSQYYLSYKTTKILEYIDMTHHSLHFRNIDCITLRHILFFSFLVCELTKYCTTSILLQLNILFMVKSTRRYESDGLSYIISMNQDCTQMDPNFSHH